MNKSYIPNTSANRFFVLSTMISLISLPSAFSAISYYSTTVYAFENDQVQLDLDRDGKDDLLIDFRRFEEGIGGGPGLPYELIPLGTSRIAVSDGIATSFSTMDVVDLSLLEFTGSSTFAGGAMFDLFGNFVAEGWGFPLSQEGERIPVPEFFVDLFLVDLGSGIAWVDFTPPSDVFSNSIRWGYSDSTDPISIHGVPEPSTALLGALGGFALLRRRRVS